MNYKSSLFTVSACLLCSSLLILDRATAAPPTAAPPTAADPGALVGLSMDSTVGVVLDELPSSMRARVASELIAKPDQFWKDRAKMQVRLANYRLVFREFFYGGKKQLPLPPEDVWAFTLSGTPSRTTIDGHDVVTVGYTFTSTLLTDYASPGISENRLERVGGTWGESFVFPVDPELLYQRTGYACMDEEDFPFDSVDSEEVDTFYDDSCGVERVLSATACHQTELPTQSCVDALRDHVGRVEPELTFTRLPWNATTADAVRVYPPTTETADLQVYEEDFHINRVEYKYFEPGSCEEQEACIGGSGWRRVLQFNSSDQNRGEQTLEIGAIDYYLSGKETLNDTYNMFTLHECHAHHHFENYGSFALDVPGAATTNKQGFCLQSTARSANHETSPLHNPYGGCDFQGVEAGWVDQYKIGLPCQWVDITDVATPIPVTADLTFASNPDALLCEGVGEFDSHGDPVFEPTDPPVYNRHGELIWKQVCDVSPGALDNNVDSYAVTLPKTGETYVSEACDRGQIGPLRNCGWDLSQATLSCTPGEQVTLRCESNAKKPAQVARVCERSAALDTPMACIERLAVASSVVSGTTDIAMTCPAARGADEPGGTFSVFTGPAFPDDASASVTCTVR